MTTDVLRVPGDYRIIAKNGNIILDLEGTTTGTVTIYGSLNVQGQLTAVASTTTLMVNRVLTLNYQEDSEPPITPSGNVSGILVDSFTANPAETATLLFDYDATVDDSNFLNTGTWKFQFNGRSAGIEASAIRIDPGSSFVNSNGSPTLNIFGVENPSAVISVAGTVDYEDNVVDDDDIPNKKYVDSLLSSANVAKKIQVGNSYVEINDSGVDFVDPYYSNPSRIIFALGTSSSTVLVIKESEITAQGITITDTMISASTGSSLILNTDPGLSVIVEKSLRLVAQDLSNPINIPSTATDQTVLYYTTSTGGGGTGIYFANPDQTDELVSRKRAIVYGIIF